MSNPLGQHTVSSYDKELEAISKTLQQMADVIIDMVWLTQKALEKKDASLFEKAEKKYASARELEKNVHQQAVKLLALRHPVANDLLFVVSSIKVAGILERMAELSKKVSRKLGKIEKAPPKKLKKNLDEMAELVAKMTHSSVAAFGKGDLGKTEKVMKKEEKVDEIRAQVMKELEQDMMKDPATIPSNMQTLAVSRNFERMGDHAVSIAQVVQDMLGEGAA